MWFILSSRLPKLLDNSKSIPADPIKVIVATDAAPLWKSSATTADVFVDVWGGPEAAGNPALWGTWWTIDGPDDIAYLQAMDYCGRLNEEIEGLEGVTHVVGAFVPLVCYEGGTNTPFRTPFAGAYVHPSH